MKVFNNKPMHIITYDCAMAQAVSCQPFTLKGWIYISPRGVVVDKLSLAQGLLRYFNFPLPLCSILIHVPITNT